MPKQKPETTGQRSIDSIPWFAGIYEGEGWLYQKKSGNWELAIEMTDKDIIDRCQSMYPDAKLCELKRKTTTGKTVWRFGSYKRELIFNILCDVYPHLGERRREKANLFISWYQNVQQEKQG